MIDLDALSPDVKQKALECKDPEELLALAKNEGYDLTDEDLEGFSGGGTDWCGFFCGDNGGDYC